MYLSPNYFLREFIISKNPIEGNFNEYYLESINLIKKHDILTRENYIFLNTYYELFPKSFKTILIKDNIEKTIKKLELFLLFPEMITNTRIVRLNTYIFSTITKFKKILEEIDDILYIKIITKVTRD